MSDSVFLPGETRATCVNRLFVYRMFNGERWIRFDDPDVDRVWDLLGVDDKHRKIAREYYLKFDAISEKGI